MDRVSIGSIVPKYTDSIFQDNTTILIRRSWLQCYILHRDIILIYARNNTINTNKIHNTCIKVRYSTHALR